MADGIVSNIAEKMLDLMSQRALQEIASCWGARDDLKKLQATIKFIQARLHDAENRHEEEGHNLIKEWLRMLRQVLYQAEDFFDEVLTVDHLNQQVKGNKVVKQVRLLFSKSGPLCYNIKMAREIKSIKEKLYDIKSNMDNLDLRVIQEPKFPMTRFMNIERETASFVAKDEIIGRGYEKGEIIDLLFDESVYVIPIVGFGGLGKTTLAQLVFNDERVKKHFDVTKWACVPMVDEKMEVFGKIYNSFTNSTYQHLSLDQLQSGILESISNKKYLLVLDDLWDENGDVWSSLLSLLKRGSSGSRIIATTRSVKIAKLVGTSLEPYELGLLSDDESWDLFRRLAFKRGQEVTNPNLVQIGREIVRRCGNVPLAIKVVGSLLYTKESEDEWRQFNDVHLSMADLTGDKIMPILKLSYDCLPPELKQCFAYCSLFPKDSLLRKGDLVQLWMAQGYLKESMNLEVEEVGDQCFLELLRRSFFEYHEEDQVFRFEGVGTFVQNRFVVDDDDKVYIMHDLMHDLAQQVAGDDCILADKVEFQCKNETMHVAFSSTNDEIEMLKEIRQVPQSLLGGSRIRSLFLGPNSDFDWKNFGCRYLRALELSYSGIEMVPGVIGELIHLRFLNLEENLMSCLPDSMARLVNLQTLNLDECRNLRELPRGFRKLVNLRCLGIKSCPLTDMPLGFGEIESIRKLNKFVVGKNTTIDSFPALKLRGTLEIEFRIWRSEMLTEARRVNLKGNQHLASLKLNFMFAAEEQLLLDHLLKLNFNFAEEEQEADSALALDHLQFPPNLKALTIHNFKGERFPKMVNELYKLVEVFISDCKNCRIVEVFSHLPKLRVLALRSFKVLEYIEDDVNNINGSTSYDYFPALERLELSSMKELKGWSRVEDSDILQPQKIMQNHHKVLPQPKCRFFPCLSKLKILECPKLMSIPWAPRLESLTSFDNVTGKVLKSLLTSHEASSSSSSSLETLRICKNDDLDSLVFTSANSIRHLDLYNCSRLRNIYEGLHHLSALETLQIINCEELDLWDDNHMMFEGKSIRGWQGLRSLRSLEIKYISKLGTLPQGIVYLTSLQSLTIEGLSKLEVLPEQIGNLPQLRQLSISRCPQLGSLPKSWLTSLQRLEIYGCPLLKKRCRKPDGKYWPFIQHIPPNNLRVSWWGFESVSDSESSVDI